MRKRDTDTLTYGRGRAFQGGIGLHERERPNHRLLSKDQRNVQVLQKRPLGYPRKNKKEEDESKKLRTSWRGGVVVRADKHVGWTGETYRKNKVEGEGVLQEKSKQDRLEMTRGKVGQTQQKQRGWKSFVVMENKERR